MSTDKKVAFITGGNRGLGLEAARELAQKNVHVVIGSRDLQNGKDAVKGLDIEVIKFDVNNAEDHAVAFKFFDEKFGKLDILINNAGVWLDNKSPSAEGFTNTSTVTSKILHDTFEANFFSPILLTQKLLPLIKLSDAGRIVNLSSILGSLTLHANPDSFIYNSKAFAYNSSKAALNAFTVHLAHELKDTKIKVNSAHPGWVKTDMGGKDAMLEVSEGGRTSVQLALLPDNGPSGGFFHLGDGLPW